MELDETLSPTTAAQRLGITRATLYNWLSQSNAGKLVVRGVPITIDYMQGGPLGQGKIGIAACEVERIKDAMRVQPHHPRPASPIPRREHFHGITVRLGRPTR